MLQVAGAGPIFGKGVQLPPVYEACRVLGLRHTLINDERSGALAADAYAKVTNRPGGVDATLGPGVTTLLTDSWRCQPSACNKEHDAGEAPVRSAASDSQGCDPRRGDRAHSRARAPRLCRRIVTRDPARMLPAADNRTFKVTKGDRPA
jgi:Thiamine pyrophosphate enzyme, N-terminal TPP binding domain